MTFTTRPELSGTFGMVASTHWLASSAGMAVLERGGNAFDAAVAAGFALQVVEPHMNGPGGDLPLLLWHHGAPRVLCGQGPAPAAASVSGYRALGLDLVPGTGYLAAARGAHPSTYRIALIAAILLFVVGIPYAALDFGRSFGRGMFMYDDLFDLRFLYDLTFRFAPLYYFYVLLQAVVAGGLWLLIRSAASDATPSAIDGRP